jgi:hypothetical protein
MGIVMEFRTAMIGKIDIADRFSFGIKFPRLAISPVVSLFRSELGMGP